MTKYCTLAILLPLFCCQNIEQDDIFQPTTEEVKLTHNYYKDAEYLKYSVKYGLLNVGEMKIQTSEDPQLIDDTPYYHVKLDAQIQGAAGWLTSLNNHYESFVDTLSLRPYKFTRDLQENKYRKKEITIFDRDRDLVIVTDTTRGIAELRVDTFSVHANMQDMISAFFLLRNTSFERHSIGDTITYDVFLENASYNIRVKYLGKEKIKNKATKGKKIDAWLIAPLIPTDKGVLSGETPLKAWISDDALKLPLKVQVKLIVGAVEMELKEYRQKNKVE